MTCDFAGARRRPATSEGLGRPSTAIGGRAGAVASATPLRRWAEGFGSDSDSPGAASEGESTLGGRGADAASASLLGEEAGAEDFTMEPKLSPRAAIAMEKRLWKVRCLKIRRFMCVTCSVQARHSLNSLPAPSHVMSRLFGTDEQWRYAQQVQLRFFFSRLYPSKFHTTTASERHTRKCALAPSAPRLQGSDQDRTGPRLLGEG